jgi:hypothetical protein
VSSSVLTAPAEAETHRSRRSVITWSTCRHPERRWLSSKDYSSASRCETGGAGFAEKVFLVAAIDLYRSSSSRESCSRAKSALLGGRASTSRRFNRGPDELPRSADASLLSAPIRPSLTESARAIGSAFFSWRRSRSHSLTSIWATPSSVSTAVASATPGSPLVSGVAIKPILRKRSASVSLMAYAKRFRFV